jgi:NitT/TauT family transport system substrate-binding protein
MWSTALFALIAAITLGGANAEARDRIRLAVQKTGTLAWELDVIRAHGLDRKLDLAIETIELASTEAGKVALKGGAADLILSDWLWVARERSLGDGLVFYPASSSLGAVMTPPSQSSIRDVVNLKGKRLAVAGGPLDKSWLLLQAFALQAGIDLKKQATVVYGAPPLLSQKALQGEADATLTYWNFCADLENKGFRRAVTVQRVIQGLGAKGPLAIIGYAFDGDWAKRNRSIIGHFLEAARGAKEILASFETEWERLASSLHISDVNALAVYRQRYSEGIVRRSLAEEESDARALYLVLADIGGAQLVGPTRELPPGTFYRPTSE